MTFLPSVNKTRCYANDEFTAMITHCKTQLKAYIARGIWNDEGFFPTIHKIDLTFQKAKQY